MDKLWSGNDEALTPDVGTDYGIEVGAAPPYSNQQFSGLLGPMALSNTDRYLSTFTPSTSLISDADTLALWTFDESSGATVFDLVGGNDLTLNGASWESVGPDCP